MSQLSTGQQSAMANTSSLRLYGPWLLAARIVWVALVTLALALFVISLPAYYRLLQVPCTSIAACQLNGAMSATGFKTLEAFGLSPSSYAAYTVVLNIVIVIVWSAVGFILFWRRSDEWIALLVGLTLVLFNTVSQDAAPTALAMLHPVWTIPLVAMNFLSELCFGIFLYLFPDGRFVPRWMCWLVILFALITAFEIFPLTDSPLNVLFWPDWVRGVIFLCIFLTVIYSQIYRYRRISTSAQRQQVKWAISGIVVSMLGVIGLNLLNGFAATVQPNSLVEISINTLFPLILLPIPLSLAVAILRYRLWDVDAIINKALVYGLLTVLLAAVYACLVLGLQALLSGLLHQTNAIALVISTLAIFALFQPFRSRIQLVIDRRFYRHKYDAAKTLETFSATLRSEVDLEQLKEQLVEVVQETMQPAHVSLWLRPRTRQQVSWSATAATLSEGEVKDEK